MDNDKLLQIIRKDLQEFNEVMEDIDPERETAGQEIRFALRKLHTIGEGLEFLNELIRIAGVAGAADAAGRESEDAAVRKTSEPEMQAVSVAEAEEPEQEDGKTQAAVFDRNGGNALSEGELPATQAPEQELPGGAFACVEPEKERAAEDRPCLSPELPLKKLEEAIGLNDRFQFVRELFDNDAGLFEQTVARIDQMDNIRQAVEFLDAHFQWKKNEFSLKFAGLVKRRFSK